MYSVFSFLLLWVFSKITFSSWLPYSNRDVVPAHVNMADSVYFIGFVLTLTALIIALSNHEISAGGPEAIQKTISRNAIALSSTVAALVIRTLWIMSLPEPPDNLKDRERELDNYRRQLADAFKVLLQNAELTALSLKDSAGSIRDGADAIKESFDSIPAATKDTENALRKMANEVSELAIDPNAITEAVGNVFREAVRGIGAAISGLSSEVNSGSENIRSGISSMRVGFDEAGQSAANSVGKFSDRLNAVNIGEVFKDKAQEALTPLRAEIERESGKLSIPLQNINQHLTTFSKSSLELIQALEAQVAVSSTATQETEKVGAALANISMELSSLSQDLREISRTSTESGMQEVVVGLLPQIEAVKTILEVTVERLPGGTTFRNWVDETAKPSTWRRILDWFLRRKK